MSGLSNTGKKVRNFSLGMKQRHRIATALISKPELMIFRWARKRLRSGLASRISTWWFSSSTKVGDCYHFQPHLVWALSGSHQVWRDWPRTPYHRIHRGWLWPSQRRLYRPQDHSDKPGRKPHQDKLHYQQDADKSDGIAHCRPERTK